MQAGPGTLALLAGAWLAYFGLHSLLAATRVKALIIDRLQWSAPVYRLGYNAVALAALIPLLWLQWQLAGAPLYESPPIARIAFDLTALVAVATFAWTLRWYDMRVFAGLAPEPAAPGEGADPDADAAAHGSFALSPLHRHVRHPWYFLSLVIIWTRPMDAAWLVACSAITLYLVVGSHLEDRKLVATYGETYRRYRDQVPGLWPWPGCSLSAAQARTLMQGGRIGQPPE